ncbi:MAG: hypothetical protein F2634_05000 [Actinobacteria bacterium]|nr:hypothetical protein [Actinomycetota bacterium]
MVFIEMVLVEMVFIEKLFIELAFIVILPGVKHQRCCASRAKPYPPDLRVGARLRVPNSRVRLSTMRILAPSLQIDSHKASTTSSATPLSAASIRYRGGADLSTHLSSRLWDGFPAQVALLLTLLVTMLVSVAIFPTDAHAAPTGTPTNAATNPATGATGVTGVGAVTPAVDFRSVTPKGPYRLVSKGKADSVTWRLERATGNKGTTCWRIVTKPKSISAPGNAPGNARCYPPVADDADSVDIPLVVAANAKRSKIGFVAIVVPKGTRSVKVGVIGGKFTPISEGKSLSGPIVFVGKKTPLWVDMTLPGKHRLACQGGVLIDKYDLKDPILTGSSVGAAWFCDEL